MVDNISKIKDRLDVVDVVSGYIKIQKAGMNFKARCPFHNEKTPSFYISPERQIWHCFGCQKGGDIFGFVKEIEGVEFPEALRILARKAGMELETFDPALKDAKSALYTICETTARFFEKQLHHSPAGNKVLVYLRDRGLNESTIKEFRLGFGPDDWHALGNFLRDCGYKEQDIINSGVALKREDGSDMYDRFRGRIIFPVFDINNQVVGFTGRVFGQVVGDSQPEAVTAKYINTPQTLIYDKSRILYGLNKAKIEARRMDRCLLVEGNMDAIMSYQAGVKNVAATSGTALTLGQLQLLQRYTGNLDFCFDTDQAGLVATRRGIGLALSQNLNVKIVQLKDLDCKDPADYIKKYGEKWKEIASSSKPVLDFYFDKLRSELNTSSVEGKKTMVAALAPFIKRLVSRVERSHWVSTLAAILKTKEDAIQADILSAKDDLSAYENYQPVSRVGPSPQPTGSSPAGNLSETILYQALLSVILKQPILFKDDLKNIDPQLFNQETARIINKLTVADLGHLRMNSFIKEFDQETALHVEFAYLKSQELLKDFSDQELKAEFYTIKNKLEHRAVAAQLTNLEFDIKEAEALKDKGKLTGLLAKFSDLTNKIVQLQK